MAAGRAPIRKKPNAGYGFGCYLGACRWKGKIYTVRKIDLLTAWRRIAAMALVLTVQALGRGATEVNPVMAWLFEQNLLLASTFKLGIGLVVATTIWRLRRYRHVLELALVLTGVFVLVLGYHIAGRFHVA